MADIKKVLKGLECCSRPKQENCMVCPYKYTPYPKGDRDVWLASCQQLYKDAMELLQRQVPKKPEHIHEEYPRHDWKLNEKGEPDDFAWGGGGYHNGGFCMRCHDTFCIHCEPNGFNEGPCIIDYYKCPGCGKEILENKLFCDKCGQAVDWNA